MNDDDIILPLKYVEKLQQKNEQLKDEIKELCKKIKVNEKSRRKMQQSLMQKLDLYKSVIDEVRKFVWNKYLIMYFEDGGEIDVVSCDDLLEILDKVKEGKNE